MDIEAAIVDWVLVVYRMLLEMANHYISNILHDKIYK